MKSDDSVEEMVEKICGVYNGMRENCTYGSMRGSRRKTAKSVLRVVADRAGVPDNKGRPALLYTLWNSSQNESQIIWEVKGGR